MKPNPALLPLPGLFLLLLLPLLAGAGTVMAQNTILIPGAAPAPARPSEERLDRMEAQIAAILEEVRALRQEMKGGGYTGKGAIAQPAETGGASGKGKSATSAAATAMKSGLVAKSYVRTGNADPASPPPSKGTPSDERLDVSATFNAGGVARGAGYASGSIVTVVWEGYFKADERDNYEFTIRSLYYGVGGTLQVGSHTISTQGGENTVRLELDPGYWPIKLTSPAVQVGDFEIKVKRSGFDPVLVTPASLWTPDTASKE